MNHPPPITMQVRGSAYRLLTREFLVDLQRHWREHGEAALDACAERWPHIYIQVVARLAQIHHVEVGGPGEFAQARTREEVLDKIGEKYGIKGRQIFEQLIAQLDRLAADGEDAAPQHGRSAG